MPSFDSSSECVRIFFRVSTTSPLLRAIKLIEIYSYWSSISRTRALNCWFLRSRVEIPSKRSSRRQTPCRWELIRKVYVENREGLEFTSVLLLQVDVCRRWAVLGKHRTLRLLCASKKLVELLRVVESDKVMSLLGQAQSDEHSMSKHKATNRLKQARS